MLLEFFKNLVIISKVLFSKFPSSSVHIYIYIYVYMIFLLQLQNQPASKDLLVYQREFEIKGLAVLQ